MSDIILDRRGQIPYVAEPRPKELPKDKEYAVRADKYNANLRKAFERMGVIMVLGSECSPTSVQYGATDADNFRATLPEDSTEVGDIIIVSEDAVNPRTWRFTIVYADEIEIADAQLVDGASGTSNYDTIQKSLIIWLVSKAGLRQWVSKNEILRGQFADALKADDLIMGVDDDTVLGTKVDWFDEEHRVDAGHEGEHKAGFLTNSMLDLDDVLKTQGASNIVKNGAFNINNAADISFWTAISATLTAPAGVCGTFPYYMMKIAVTDADQGAYQDLIDLDVGEMITATFFAKGTNGKKIRAVLQTDTLDETLPITCTGSFVEYSLQFTPDNICSNPKIKFLSDETGAQDFYIAYVCVRWGNVRMKAERAASDVMYDAVHDMAFYMPDLAAAAADEIYASFVLEKNIKIISIYAYSRVAAATADATIRLSDGTNNVDVVIANLANAGHVHSAQEYAKAATLTLTLLQNTTTNGDDVSVVIQYRIN